MPSAPQAYSTAHKPALLDRVCDYDLPRLFTGYRPDDAPWEVVRALNDGERGLVEARAGALRVGLSGYAAHERDDVEAAIGAMLGGFRSMRQQDESAEAVIAAAASALRDMPQWAIVHACRMIASGEAGLDIRFAPNDAEIASIVHRVIAPYRQTLATLDRLLTANVRPPPTPKLSLEDMEAKLGRAVSNRPFHPARESDSAKISDGKHAQRVSEQLAHRRAQRAAE